MAMAGGRSRRRSLLAILVAVCVGGGCGSARERSVKAGFWFENVSFESSRLGGALTAEDMRIIEAVARAEIVQAFDGLRFELSAAPTAAYRVRVVQQLRDLRFRSPRALAGQSWALPGGRGEGAVGFEFLASSAAGYAPSDAPRDAIVEAIGRGVGRAAVHEFTHELLPSVPIDRTKDVGSYEFFSGARREQYYGPMHWDIARPRLEERYAR